MNMQFNIKFTIFDENQPLTKKQIQIRNNLSDDDMKQILKNAIIGLNDYLIYDGIIEDQPYGTFQTVNEFLEKNNDWSVDAIALHNLGFYDIYIRKNK